MTFQEVVVGGVLRAGLRTYRLTPPIRAGYKGRFILLLEAATLVFPAMGQKTLIRKRPLERPMDFKSLV